MKFFTDIQQKQQALDDKLKKLEERFSKSVSDNYTCSVGSTDKCNYRECNGIGRKWVYIYKQNSGTILSDIINIFTSISAEEKEKEKRNPKKKNS